MVGGSNPSGPTGGELAKLIVPAAAGAPAATRRIRWHHVVVALVGLAIAAIAIGALRRIAHEVTLAHLAAALHAVAWPAVALAAAATAASYLILTGYDALALGHLGYRLPLARVATASFTSFTMSHTLGVTALTGGTVRFRQYTRAGVRPADIVLIVALCGWTFWLSIVIAAGLGLAADPRVATAARFLSPGVERSAGVALLGGAGAYILLAALYRRPLRLLGLTMRLPGLGRTLAQLAVGGLDLIAAAAALYFLLPAGAVPFDVLVTVYAVAMIAGALSHAPGGLGVFETVILVMLPQVAPGRVLAALLLFRLLYTLIPFVLGLALLVRTEVVALSRRHAAPAA